MHVTFSGRIATGMMKVDAKTIELKKWRENASSNFRENTQAMFDIAKPAHKNIASS